MQIDILVVAFWSLMFVIGVSDAKNQRIPNKLVVLLFVVSCVHVFSYGTTDATDHLTGAFIAFCGALVLYWRKAMAAGDVKLLFVIGFWVGFDQLLPVLAAIIMAGGVVSCFYLAQFLATSQLSLQQNLQGYYYYRTTYKFSHRTKLVIPFAPAIVIGLASYYYLY
ncbi:hypothetical protein BIY22_11320 [Vibrio panuliri]|uniref:Prepilin type IV endopeptidase peptidase domain-containing protein n=1 Tax=Vibrio panuliri TaxID=1381081 RepID=A0A1Q9HCM3_9VIBR|nr:prepilin peptidase [Vibrio panuliri]OLQ87151.1 hypothetical protein BIY22_11320 [Vibrio panuliri]